MAGKPKNNNSANSKSHIVIKGARVHNLKNIDVSIPRDKLVVVTGLSGSGKSSLAFDTIYAEGQRRYIESLSSYARQFLGAMDKPDVDSIEGLGPAISIDQRSVSHNPRSTVGTITEIYDYLRLLFARVGIPHCPKCGDEVSKQTIDQIVDRIYKLTPLRQGYGGSPPPFAKATGGSDKSDKPVKIMLLAPVIRDKKGEHKNTLEEIQKAGYVRVRIDKNIYPIEEAIDLDIDKKKKHSVDVIVDRLEITSRPSKLDRSRLSESLEATLDLGNGLVIVYVVEHEETKKQRNREIKGTNSTNNANTTNEVLFSQHFACAKCDINLPELEPRSFSFNSPYGACPECTGLGMKLEVDPELVIPNKKLTIAQGAIRPWSSTAANQGWYFRILKAVAKQHKFSLDKPIKNYTREQLDIILHGTGSERYTVDYASDKFEGEADMKYEGLIPSLERRYRETQSDYIRSEIEKYMRVKICPVCDGKRLKPEVLGVTVGARSIAEVTGMTVEEGKEFFEGLAR